jgi:hypothetical protein
MYDATDGALIRGLAVVLVLLTGCTTEVFSDSEPIEPYEPPPPRNACEQVFGAELMMDIGTGIDPIAAPTPESVRTTFKACSAEELVAANEYFVYASGPQMGQLLTHRLPIDPGDMDDLVGMCADETLATTRACELHPPSRSP